MTEETAGWILWEQDRPVGTGPSAHAAIADARRRTKCRENSRQTLRPAGRTDLEAAAGRLGPGGLTTAEAAWCAGTQNATPAYRRPVDAARPVLQAAERLGGRREGLQIEFADGSGIELVPLGEHVGGGQLVRLPPAEERRPAGWRPCPG